VRRAHAERRAGEARARPERLEARVSREQKALLQRAAELQGRTLMDFVVASAHQAVVRTIEEMTMIRLSAEDCRTSAEAMLYPREPAGRFRAAARRYIEAVEDSWAAGAAALLRVGALAERRARRVHLRRRRFGPLRAHAGRPGRRKRVAACFVLNGGRRRCQG